MTCAWRKPVMALLLLLLSLLAWTTAGLEMLTNFEIFDQEAPNNVHIIVHSRDGGFVANGAYQSLSVTGYLVTSDLRKIQTTAVVNISRPVREFVKVYISNVPEHVGQHTVTYCEPRLSAPEVRTGVAQDSINALVNTSFGAIPESAELDETLDDGELDTSSVDFLVHFAAQAVTDDDTFEIPSTKGQQALLDEQFRIVQLSGNDLLTQMCGKTGNCDAEDDGQIGLWKRNLKRWSQDLNVTVNFAREFLDLELPHLLEEFNRTSLVYRGNFDKYANNYKSLLDDAVEPALRGAQEMLDQNRRQLAAAQQATITRAIAVAHQLQNMVNASSGTIAHFNAILQANNVTNERVRAIMEELHEFMQHMLENGRFYQLSLEDEQKHSKTWHTLALMLSHVYAAIVQVSGGHLRPLVSSTTRAPLGFVPTHPGDDASWVTLQLVYSQQIENQDLPVANIDTAVEHLPPATVNADVRYRQSLQCATAQHPSCTVIVDDLAEIVGFCSNDFLLAKRGFFYTVFDVMRFIGPRGCTPFVNCSCWMQTREERCSVLSSRGAYASSTVIQSLADTQRCRDVQGAELHAWYSPVGTAASLSITRRSSVNVVTDVDELNAFIGRHCRQNILGSFRVQSSTFRDGSRASVFTAPNRIDLCSTNHIGMAAQSAQLVNAGGRQTLPLLLYNLATVATQRLFERVRTQWETEKYGTEDRHVTRDVLHFFPSVGSYRAPNTTFYTAAAASALRTGNDERSPLPTPQVLGRCELDTIASVSSTSVPCYLLKATSSRYRQSVNVSIRHEYGQVLQRSFTILRDDDGDAASGAALESNWRWGDVIPFCGYLDCTQLPCDNFGISDSGQSRILYDLDANAFSGLRSTEARLSAHAVDAFAEFAVPFQSIVDGSAPGRGTGTGSDTARFVPFAPVGHDHVNKRATIDADTFAAQEDIESIQPGRMVNGLQNYLRRLKRNPETGGWQLNPIDVQNAGGDVGIMGEIMQEHMFLVPSRIAPGLDAARTVSLAFTGDYSTPITFEVPPRDVTASSGGGAPPPKCPDPARMRLLPLMAGANATQLMLVNQFEDRDLVLCIAVASSGADADLCRPTMRTLEVPAQSSRALNLPPSPPCGVMQTVRVALRAARAGPCTEVGALGTVCWESTLNTTLAFARADERHTPVDGTARVRGNIATAAENVNMQTVQRLPTALEEARTKATENAALQSGLVLDSMVSLIDSAVDLGRTMRNERLAGRNTVSTFSVAARQDMTANVARVVQEGTALEQTLQLLSAQSKQRDAVLSKAFDALRTNMSQVINVLKHEAELLQEFRQTVVDNEARRVNITARIVAIDRRIRDKIPRVSAKLAVLAQSIDATPHAFRDIEDRFTRSPTYWKSTRDIQDVIDAQLLRLGLAGLKIADKALKLADKLLNQLDGPCEYGIEFICDLLNALQYVCLILFIAFWIWLLVQVCKK